MIPITILIWVHLSWAATPFKFWERPQEIFIGCEKYINGIAKFLESTGSPVYWCGKNALETMVGCLVESGLDFGLVGLILENNCQTMVDSFDETVVMIAYASFKSNAQPHSGEGSLAYYPVFLNRTEVIKSQEASIILYDLKNRAMYFGVVLNCYWLVVFMIATIANWLARMLPSLRVCLTGNIATWIRGYFTLPALGKKHKMLSKKVLGFIHFYSPSRMESSLITAFVLLSVTLCSIGYTPNKNTTFNPITRDYVHYLANRSAIMSTALVPLVFLLSGRNNILQSCTQWDHSTFMLYHRWIGRVCIIGIVIHSVVASISLDLHGLYLVEIESWYVVWGIAGTVACTMLLFGGFLYFRRFFYETFFILHLVLAGLFLVSSWFHLADLGYLFLMSISITLFLMDRFFRYIRLLYFGFPEATITLHNDDTLRVEIPCPRYFFSVPGGHCWLTFGRFFWQSHPFSCIESPEKKNTLVFLCGVKLGVTRRIANRARSSTSKSIRMRVSMEGVYGRPAPTQWHSLVIFIAGGKGFPGIFSEAYGLAQNCCDNPKKIKFIWITKDPVSLECCAEELHALRNTSIETVIYFTKTRGKSQTPVEEGKMGFIVGSSRVSAQDSETKVGGFLEETYPHITFLYYKPELSDIVTIETENCRGSIAFVSCGHPAMVDAMRVSVVGILPQTVKRVDYYDQLQGWA